MQISFDLEQLVSASLSGKQTRWLWRPSWTREAADGLGGLGSQF
jgi:hypothetical protein